jgi:hypothetical protein
LKYAITKQRFKGVKAMTSLKTLAIPGLMLSLLSACGGGGGGDGSSSAPPPPVATSAEGLWKGTTSNGRTIAGLVLNDGSYWFLYTAIGNSAVLGGAVQGHGSSSNGTFTSSDGLDFNFEGQGLNPFTLSGMYAQKSTLSGTVSFSGGSFTVDTTYDAEYETAPSLTTIAGTYSGTAVSAGGYDSAMVTIASSGAITGSSGGGCTFSGTATPRSTGNAYDVSVTFAGGTCSNGTDTVTGVAHYDATDKRLISAALNSGRSNGFYYDGVKP